MSGIFGIFNRNGSPVSEASMAAMCVALRHRGPDGQGISCDGAVGLGHLMLHTTPESLLEKLPVCTPDGTLAITADARIDNRQDLMRDLGLVLPTVTDSDLILEAYRRWGTDCPDRLLGDFAFAIWDAKRQALFCASDHFGLKPFYYFENDDVFAFASESSALFVLSGVPRLINDKAIAAFLALEEVGRQELPFQLIRCLAPATSLTVTAGDVMPTKYWSLGLETKAVPMSDEAYAARLRELFTEAVRCRMRSAFPVGSMLSGGLDSSSITCVARKITTDGAWPTFSARFPKGDAADESEYIDAVLAESGFQPYSVEADKLDPMGPIDELIAIQGEPDVPGNLYVNWNLYETACKAGVRIVFEGFDGDNVISHGTGYLAELARNGRWLKLAVELRGYATNISKESWQDAFWSWVARFGPAPVRFVVRKISMLKRRSVRDERTRRPDDNQDLSAILGPKLVRCKFDSDSSRWEPARTEREMHLRMLTLPCQQTAMHLMDRTAAAHGIELRFPFWDKRLVEYCLSLPPEQKMRRGTTRFVMRRAMQDILPPKVQWRLAKANLAPRHEISMASLSRKRIESALSQANGDLREYLSVDVATDIYNKIKAGLGTKRECVLIWRAACLSMWWRVANSEKFAAHAESIGKEVT